MIDVKQHTNPAEYEFVSDAAYDSPYTVCGACVFGSRGVASCKIFDEIKKRCSVYHRRSCGKDWGHWRYVGEGACNDKRLDRLRRINSIF